jgi:3-oxoacyl-[acyl-carrier protein] reductase
MGLEARMSPLAVITGASSGIGYATAQLLLEQGWQVLALSRRPCTLKGAINLAVDLESDDLEKFLCNNLPKIINSSSNKDIRKIALIHNAAKFVNDSALGIETKNIIDSLKINVIASTIINKVVFPHMQRGSSIIYVGSTLSEKAVANTASYVISKHAVVGLMRATCQDLCGTGIHTTCVCPGFVDTPMLRGNKNDTEMTQFEELTSYKKLLTAPEMASIILNSVNTPALNGSVIHANYGQIEH